MRPVTIYHITALAILMSGCATTVTLDEGEYLPPLLPSFDVEVGKSFTGKARSATLMTGLDRIELGKVAVQRLGHSFDGIFRETEELEMWPPWQISVPLDLDGVIEVDNVLGSIESSHPDSRSILIEFDACLYDRDGSEVSCWEGRVVETYSNSSSTSMVDAAVDSAAGMLLLEITNDRDVKAWVDRANSRAACDKGDGCIGMLWWPSDSQSASSEFAQDIQNCLSRHINKVLPNKPLISMRRLRRLLHPLMERSTEPRTEDQFVDLLNRDDVHRRMLAYGIRHIVAFSGRTDADDYSGPVACGYGYGGGGCLGIAWAHKETSLRAVTIDLTGKGDVEHISALDEGTSLMPAFILPIPIPAATEEDACRELAEQIVASVADSQ